MGRNGISNLQPLKSELSWNGAVMSDLSVSRDGAIVNCQRGSFSVPSAD
jgi:hypothetical protein